MRWKKPRRRLENRQGPAVRPQREGKRHSRSTLTYCGAGTYNLHAVSTDETQGVYSRYKEYVFVLQAVGTDETQGVYSTTPSPSLEGKNNVFVALLDAHHKRYYSTMSCSLARRQKERLTHINETIW